MYQNDALYEQILSKKNYKAKSIMLGVSASDSDFVDFDSMIDRVRENDEFTEISIDETEEAVELTFMYSHEKFSVNLSVGSPEIDEMYGASHDLTQTEILRLQNAEFGLKLEMFFGNKNLNSFHLQIKLLHILLPNIVGIVDYSSLNILSGRWVKLASLSAVAPSFEYIYRIHVVKEDDVLWMHTHGLDRCGSVELEIMNVKAEEGNTEALSSIINTFASIIIEKGLIVKAGEPLQIGDNIVATWLKWEDVIGDLDCIGANEGDRVDHDGPSGVIYLYLTEENYNKKIFTHPYEMIEHLRDNPLFFFSNEETERMKKLAHERIIYVHEYGLERGNKVLIKAGLEVDPANKDVPMEHLWFELLEFEDDDLKVNLLSDPRYIAKLSVGDEISLKVDEITDWIIYTDTERIDPNNVYLLEELSVNEPILNDSEAFNNQIDAWHNAGRHDRIIDFLSGRKILDYDQITKYSRALNNIGNSEAAVEKLLSVKEQGETDYLWFYRLAYAYNLMGRHGDALISLENSQKLKSDYPFSWLVMGEVYIAMRDYSKAIEALEKSIFFGAPDELMDKSELEYINTQIETCREKLLLSTRYN